MEERNVDLLYKDLVSLFMNSDFLDELGFAKKDLRGLLRKGYWTDGIEKIIATDIFSCTDILELCRPSIDRLGEMEPEEGWLSYIYRYLLKEIYPHRKDIELAMTDSKTVILFLAVYRLFLEHERRMVPFEKTKDFAFLTEEETQNTTYAVQYHQFLSAMDRQHIYELMRIGKEIMPFDTLAHVAGVHYIAMHIARQMVAVGLPVDLGLISGAAAGHDIGKYGCKDTEIRRMPYLHYYYTDIWFSSHNLKEIGHVAANHSTWDLELENLPAESLILIYADFRVKTECFRNGKEVMGFYSLEDSFRVILDKLDNVDAAKENRYRHVYSRLVDFETYLHALGINTDLQKETISHVEHKELALLNIAETVAEFKNIAVSHNIHLMHKLSRESSFGSMLEAARSTRDWRTSRAYLNIFSEYFTYMSQKQKQMALNFLYEFMVHREGDIRRQAGDLLGNIIAHYDVAYGKELPTDVDIVLDDTTGYEVWEKYLDKILNPDHKMTLQHRRWLGYSLKKVVASLLENCKVDARKRFMDCLLECYKKMEWEDDIAFILMDTLPTIPQELLTETENQILFQFMEGHAERLSLEIRAAILLNLKDMAPYFLSNPENTQFVKNIIQKVPINGNYSLEFLMYSIGELYGLQEHMRGISYKRIFEDDRVVSDIFLENLKAATPWKIKIINIELLYERTRLGKPMPKLHVATHLSNLLKVSEQVTVRHFAGETLVRLAPLLSWDQRNEVSVELMKGLEIGGYEFSKYIPEYFGEFILYLHPKELDEIMRDLQKLQCSTNEQIASIALNTFGVMIRHYKQYRSRFPEYVARYDARRKKLLGMILSGFASYQSNLNREAFWVMGHELFASKDLTMKEKRDIFAFIGKKLVTMVETKDESELAFLNDTVGWNSIYRFIGDYLFQNKTFAFAESKKIAFFPGTFDPFSLGHKQIAKEIRDLGFSVYLALDDFSWSKKTQPHEVRRKILHMSIANEENIFLFPGNIPVNIANPRDLKRLRSLFPDKEVYMVAGSDVVKNASSYHLPVVENSIQTFPHVLFVRDDGKNKPADYSQIVREVLELKLPNNFEEISSTRIRENIDNNRDISNLIDTVAQNYIYKNSLYLREPQYKKLLETRSIEIRMISTQSEAVNMLYYHDEIAGDMVKEMVNAIAQKDARMIVVADKNGGGIPEGIMVYRQISTSDLYHEFEDIQLASYIREHTSGKIVLITACFASANSKIQNIEQILLTETLAECLSRDFTYAIFSPKNVESGKGFADTLLRQGFLNITDHGERDIYAVDMKNPITLYQNVETAIKEPFNTNERVLEVLQNAHYRMQEELCKLFPGELVISFDAGIMHNRLIDLITKENEVPRIQTLVRNLGKKMCVPYGKILKGIVIPNTVTKVMHTEKVFNSDIRSFHIQEYPEYPPLDCQARTLKSFNRPVILVDDLLHKGYRLNELYAYFEAEGVEVSKIIVGILSGRGHDLMEIKGSDVNSAYFIPSLRAWFVESSMYPFIGGDAVGDTSNKERNMIDSVNLILPYVMPGFVGTVSKRAIYDLSMTCLQNTKDILTVLEEEYQREFEKSLTLDRLNEVIIAPRCPDRGDCVKYDYHIAASDYISNDIERLVRLQQLIQ
ncbi:hypothetical protein [Chakrabartyella piscis]|uniref:nicotinate-nicotinamide nucleotide adenylyltransferase n=1 Tax=Chakrabartyella piscis TaxID=2918914 RepID=UPI002958CE3D|nr:hypothetical protein [Chakrabartyella piscis]